MLARGLSPYQFGPLPTASPSPGWAGVHRLYLPRRVPAVMWERRAPAVSPSYHEAELLDERRYEDWLALLADEVRYWRPMRPAGGPLRGATPTATSRG